LIFRGFLLLLHSADESNESKERRIKLSLLLDLPGSETSQVNTHFSDDQLSVIESLEDCPELQWRYLHGAMEAASDQVSTTASLRGGSLAAQTPSFLGRQIPSEVVSDL
jgi:hypothetical protein